MIRIRPIQPEDAAELFPLLNGSGVTDTLVWDGPASFEEYRMRLTEFSEQTHAGEIHIFTILEGSTGRAIGNVGVRPYEGRPLADIGIWIGAPFHGLGYGTAAIAAAAEYGFRELHLTRIEAYVFVGNLASRRAFEKNGFHLEETLTAIIKKRGRVLDEWRMVLSRENIGF